MWASIPQTMTLERSWSRTFWSNSGWPPQEKVIFSITSAPPTASFSPGMVGPNPLTYCSVTSVGTSRISAPRARVTSCFSSAGASVMTFQSRSWQSMTTSRSSSTRATVG